MEVTASNLRATGGTPWNPPGRRSLNGKGTELK